MINYLSFIQGHRIFDITGVLTVSDLLVFKEKDVSKLTLWNEAEVKITARKQRQIILQVHYKKNKYAH